MVLAESGFSDVLCRFMGGVTHATLLRTLMQEAHDLADSSSLDTSSSGAGSLLKVMDVTERDAKADVSGSGARRNQMFLEQENSASDLSTLSRRREAQTK